MRLFALPSLVAAFAALTASAHADLVDVPALGLRLERGFRITQISDEQLANDIWCMTLNPRGEVVVSGAGYIATLLDTDGDGKLDKAVKFADTKGAMGLCFDETGKQLLVMGDGWLSEYRDDNLDRVADGGPRHILPFSSGEHGGHAIRRGPDGWWWVIGGNDSGMAERHAEFDEIRVDELKPDAPRRGVDVLIPPTWRAMRAGGIVRLSPDLKTEARWADGFRNPYDFDFNERGDVFLFDSDCERDYFLPWYSGCRVYHAKAHAFHGWRLTGYQRSFRVPDYMPETVPALADMGRGSPTGVLVYRGGAFPKHYRGGVFIEDWTFGKIHYVPLIPEGSGYITKTEVFLEPIGTAGFAPTDIVETADGALLVSIGGRKTRGAIYRIEAEKSFAFPEIPVLAHAAPPAPPELAALAAAQDKLGGWKLTGASSDAFVPYEPVRPQGLAGRDRQAAAQLAEDGLLSLDDRVVTESARLLAMLSEDSSRAAENVMGAITEKSSPTSDFHFLACLACLSAKPEAERTGKIARAVLDLDRKLAGGDRRPKQMWPVRLNDVVERLEKNNPGLAEALLAQSGFATGGHLPLVDVLPVALRPEAAKKYLAAVVHPAPGASALEWTPELIKLLAGEPEARPLLRGEWKNLGLRTALREALSRGATAEDEVLLAEPDHPVVAQDLAAIEAFANSLKPVAWEKGDAARGDKLFHERACATCHAGTSPIGPDLSGPVARLSPSDLYLDVQFPSRSIAEAFRATLFTLKDGTQRNGFVAFVSADGVIVQTGPGQTERIPETDIVRREQSDVSLMPPGLLTGMEAGQLADLYAYLQTLKK